MSDTLVHTTAAMGTVVTLQVIGHGVTADERRARRDAIERAAGWFQRVNDTCTRFDPESELCGLSKQIGVAVPVSTTLFEAVRFALAVAEETGGAFDPTVGGTMAAHGFDREYRTGAVVRHEGIPDDRPPNHHDVEIDAAARTITLHRPLVLDLGAVAKGLAVDLAARELAPFADFAIDAGGDLFLGGHNADGEAWAVGIRDPRRTDQLIATLRVSGRAVCTSGDYERPAPGATPGHHVIDPRTGDSVTGLASVTVVADSAMVADALATAAFVLGPREGIAFLDAHHVDGLLVTPRLERFVTPGLRLD